MTPRPCPPRHLEISSLHTDFVSHVSSPQSIAIPVSFLDLCLQNDWVSSLPIPPAAPPLPQPPMDSALSGSVLLSWDRRPFLHIPAPVAASCSHCVCRPVTPSPDPEREILVLGAGRDSDHLASVQREDHSWAAVQGQLGLGQRSRKGLLSVTRPPGTLALQ